MRTVLLIVTIILSCSFTCPDAFAAKSLYWKALNVEATLDVEGRLHVMERHQMVFTGDWNGGERRFRVAGNQRLRFQGLARVDTRSGGMLALREGDLSNVDHYSWFDKHVLRWRSRLPTDPAFEETELVYMLYYTLDNTLLPTEEGYLLDHDFAFPERHGAIEEFTLTLHLDPIWQTEQPIPEIFRTYHLAPGTSQIMKLPLVYQGTGKPAGVAYSILFMVPAYVRCSLVGAFLLIAFFYWWSFYRNEKALGRFEPLPPLETIDRQWLKQNILSYPPEVVGAAWDNKVGPSEVGAVIARMVEEGKLHSEVRTGRFEMKGEPVLFLSLLVDRHYLRGYEYELVEALFFENSTTDSERLLRHYGNVGFNPAGILTSGLQEKIAKLFPAPANHGNNPSYGFWLIPCALGLLAAGSVDGSFNQVAMALFGFIFLFLLAAMGWMAASEYSRTLTPKVSPLVLAAMTFIMASGFLALAKYPLLENNVYILAGLILQGVFNVRAWSLFARYHGGPRLLALQRNMVAARNYFKFQLALAVPSLEDAWFPYAVAFGLQKDVDRWFQKNSVPVEWESDWLNGPFEMTSLDSSSSQQGSLPSGWSGGAFGGAGATGAWAAAVSGMAAGIPSPQLQSRGSSSGGLSSGGSSSSGGGGGGGW